MTLIYRLDPRAPSSEALWIASRALRRGELVAFPTETVYGLGANGLDPQGVTRIFRAKGRPGDNPLILHFSRIEQIRDVAVLDSRARGLLERFAPGPLTLVLPALKRVPSATRGGLETVGVRIPDCLIARELIRLAGVPVAAPSANSSGRPSPTDAETVRSDLGHAVSVLLDGGATPVGLESTVLDVSGPLPVLLRPGKIALEELRDHLGEVLLSSQVEELRKSPGTRYRHYAPSLPLHLWNPGEGDRLFRELRARGVRFGYLGVRRPPGEVETVRLFSDISAYARELYRSLREMEVLPLQALVAEMPSPGPLERALRDRLFRASGEKKAEKTS